MIRISHFVLGFMLLLANAAFSQETKPDETPKPAPGLPPPSGGETRPEEKKADEPKPAETKAAAVKPEEKKPDEKKAEEPPPRRSSDKEESKDYSSTIGLAGYFGFQVPLSPYVNNMKLMADNNATYTLDELKNKVGFAMSLMLTLGNWEFAYNWIVAPLDQLLFTPSQITKGGVPWTSPRDMSGDDSYQFHSFTAGYRIYFTRGQIRPYLSPHFGLAFVNPGAGATTYLIGAEFGAGLGVNIHITKGLALGIVARYRFFITRNPNETEAQNAFIGGTLSGNTTPTAEGVFSTFAETGSFLTVMGGFSLQL